MTSDLTEALAKMRKVAKEIDELRNPPPPQERNLEGLALTIMAVVYLVGGYAISLILAMFFYGCSVDSTADWHWGTAFLVSYWIFFAGVVIAALALAYDWAENTLNNAHKEN